MTSTIFPEKSIALAIFAFNPCIISCLHSGLPPPLPRVIEPINHMSMTISTCGEASTNITRWLRSGKLE